VLYAFAFAFIRTGDKLSQTQTSFCHKVHVCKKISKSHHFTYILLVIKVHTPVTIGSTAENRIHPDSLSLYINRFICPEAEVVHCHPIKKNK